VISSSKNVDAMAYQVRVPEFGDIPVEMLWSLLSGVVCVAKVTRVPSGCTPGAVKAPSARRKTSTLTHARTTAKVFREFKR
jgi:hypothetical protein